MSQVSQELTKAILPRYNDKDSQGVGKTRLFNQWNRREHQETSQCSDNLIKRNTGKSTVGKKACFVGSHVTS